MAAVKEQLVRFMACRAGATAIEYSLIAGAIAVGVAAVIFVLGSSVSGLFSSVSASF